MTKAIRFSKAIHKKHFKFFHKVANFIMKTTDNNVDDRTFSAIITSAYVMGGQPDVIRHEFGRNVERIACQARLFSAFDPNSQRTSVLHYDLEALYIILAQLYVFSFDSKLKIPHYRYHAYVITKTIFEAYPDQFARMKRKFNWSRMNLSDKNVAEKIKLYEKVTGGLESKFRGRK